MITLRAGLAVVLILSAAAAPLSAWQARSAANYVVGPQDVLTIQVFDQPEIGGKFTVEADGTFTFPMIGRIKAGGKTLRQFEEDLKSRLADGYFRNPQVSVAIEQYRSQRIFIMGEVMTNGPVPLTGGMTLIEALARAGGTRPSASGEVVIVRASDGADGPVLPNQIPDGEVLRADIRDLEEGTLKDNVALRDGDTIWVSRAESIYVFGEVKSPNAYAVQNDTTVLQALSLAGGATEHAALNRIDIIRMVDGERKRIRVKLDDIVQPGDTIQVPQRYF